MEVNMNIPKYWTITFDIKKGGFAKYCINIEAYSAKEAKLKAENMWKEYSTAHMFHILARELEDDKEFLYHWFKKLQ